MKSCKLVNTNGVVSVFNSDGSFSKVYQQALEKTNSIEEATKLWSYTQTELWEDIVGTNDATDLNEVFRFLNNLNELEIKPPTLSSQEVEEVRKLMTEMGVEDSNVFVTKMNSLFQPKGFFEINRQRLLKSGLYDNSDIDSLDVKKVKNFLAKMNIYFSENEISNTEVFTSNIKFKDVSTEKNSLGFHSFISLPQIALEVTDLTDDFSKKGIEEALLQTEFAEGVESQTFVNNLYNYLSNKTKVTKMSISNGEQVTETSNIVRNTLLSDQDTLEIEETNSFLGGILPSVWESKQKTIESYLRKVEKMLANYNIDIIGISANSLNREGVISLLSSVEEMMKNPTEENVQNFSNLKDELIPAGRAYTLKEGVSRNLTNVVVDSNMSQEELFETQGLLKLNNEGVYQLIDRAYSVEELYDELYQRVLEDSVIIDEKYFNDNAEAVKDPLYEAEVKEALKRWINSRQIGFSAPRMGEEISLYQVLFNHNSIENNNNYTPLSGEFSEGYLTTSFVSDFYNYILDEKYKDSDIYKNVLQYFSVGGSDINYNHPTNSVVNIGEIKYSKQLKEYAKLKKEGSIKAFADNSEYVNEDLKVLNNPNLAQEVQNTEYNISDGYLVTKGVNANTYLTEGGKLYRKLFDDIAGSIYAEVVTNNDNVYNDLNLDFSYDATEAKKRLKESYNYFSEQTPKNPKQANVSPTIESSIIGYYTQTEIDEIVVPYQNENGELTYDGQRFDNKQQLIKHLELKGVLDQLMKTNLAKSYHILSPEQIQAKLVELGVDADVAFQISAWHGSPHKFNRFSTEFIGSGEGNQAFGWGLYFTDLESIAREYAKNNIRSKVFINGKKIDISEDLDLERIVKQSNGDLNILKKEMKDYYDEYKDNPYSDANVALEIYEAINNNEDVNLNLGESNLYNVTLHKGKQPSEYTWLEWDKPIDKKALGGRFVENLTDKQIDIVVGYLGNKNQTGEMLYEGLSKALGSPKAASLFLLENGIDGIKYPAESISSGTTSDNARGFNYVVFDENAITIEEVIQFQKEGITLLPNGFYHNGKVYINRDLADLSTPIHEFGHAYSRLLKNEKPEFYQEGLRLIEKEGQQYVDFVKKNQPNLQGEALLEEALQQAVGDAGARLIKTEENKGLLNWLQNAWNNIKQMLGLSSYTIEQVRNMSLQEYTNAVAVDLLRGESLGDSVESISKKLEELQTLELEDDQVIYPKYVEEDVTDIANLGGGYYLQINNKESLPEAGSFEIFVTDYNNDVLGFIRGNKNKTTITFNLIHLKEDNRGQGIGKNIYKYFLNSYNIKSDSEITADTEMLYNSLLKDGYRGIITSNNRVEILSNNSNFQINTTEQELQQIKNEAIANGTFMKAPNGKDTNLNERQWLQVRSKAFIENFFGDWLNNPENASKVVDSNGEPMIVAHSTPVEFTEFDINKFGRSDEGYHGKGFYFSQTRRRGDGQIVPYHNYGKNKMFVFLNIRNPATNKYENFGRSDEGDLKNNDGIFSGKLGDPFTEIVARSSNQIKSATDNVGTFSSETNDIRYQIRREYEQQKLNAVRKVNEIDLKITTEIKEDINECSWIS